MIIVKNKIGHVRTFLEMGKEEALSVIAYLAEQLMEKNDDDEERIIQLPIS